MRALLLLLFCVSGCVATPLPDPPSADTLFVSPMSTGPLRIDGMSGAVEPGATIAAVNLDTTDPFVRAVAAADGGFTLLVVALDGDIVRMHVEVDGARSQPLDIVISSGTPVAFVPPLVDCLNHPASIAIGDVAVGSTRAIAIPIENECGADVLIDGIALRAPAAGLTPRTVPPLTVAASSSAVIEVDVAPAAAGSLEEVLLLNVAAPETGRRAITLYGTAR